MQTHVHTLIHTYVCIKLDSNLCAIIIIIATTTIGSRQRGDSQVRDATATANATETATATATARAKHKHARVTPNNSLCKLSLSVVSVLLLSILDSHLFAAECECA